MVRIGVFGAGSALKDFLSVLPKTVSLIGLSDNNADRHGCIVEGHKIVSARELVAMNADLYVITARAIDPIRKQLVDLGVPADIICAYYPSYSQDLAATINRDIDMLNNVLALNLPAAGIATMYLWPEHEDRPKSAPGEDYVRRQIFRLCAERINDRSIPGAIAELGVYQGEQAALLNRLFPDRTLHLFDTFEGFAEQDLASEQSAGFSSAVLGDFHDTSIELVMEKMSNPDIVQIHKGFFPSTADGVEDTFAFVSLDVDLFEPTLAGLDWFYSRLQPGGYIFVHDYNNRRYLGVRNAVDQFLTKSGACALPLADFAGSIVILR